MKKLLLVLCIMFISSISLFAQDLCYGITCPEGWYLNQTDWIKVKVNEVPDSCWIKVCFCCNFEEEEGPNFWIKRIIWDDIECAQNIDVEILKLGIMAELIKSRFQVDPLVLCPNHSLQYSCELYTDECYSMYKNFGTPVTIPCLGEGYCAQVYTYCWDITTTPWTLNVAKYGPPASYSTGTCTIPHPHNPPEWELINGCVPWCNE